MPSIRLASRIPNEAIRSGIGHRLELAIDEEANVAIAEFAAKSDLDLDGAQNRCAHLRAHHEDRTLRTIVSRDNAFLRAQGSSAGVVKSNLDFVITVRQQARIKREGGLSALGGGRNRSCSKARPVDLQLNHRRLHAGIPNRQRRAVESTVDKYCRVIAWDGEGGCVCPKYA